MKGGKFAAQFLAIAPIRRSPAGGIGRIIILNRANARRGHNSFVA
jgi:hypothetical protein